MREMRMSGAELMQEESVGARMDRAKMRKVDVAAKKKLRSHSPTM